METEAAKADGAGEESTAAHPLQFLFRLTMGLAEQDKAGAYVFCPYSKVSVAAATQLFSLHIWRDMTVTPPSERRSLHRSQSQLSLLNFLPIPQGTFRTRVDRHRRFTLSLSQSSFQPMAFERASRIGISMVTPWRRKTEGHLK